MILELTDAEREALETIIGIALSDQDYYLECGSPELDYAVEWPSVAAEKAEIWARMKSVCTKLGLPGFASSAECLAQEFDEAAHDGCGLCVTCGTRCVSGGEGSVICPQCSASEVPA